VGVIDDNTRDGNIPSPRCCGRRGQPYRDEFAVTLLTVHHYTIAAFSLKQIVQRNRALLSQFMCQIYVAKVHHFSGLKKSWKTTK
jgi:hypothetical protein